MILSTSFTSDFEDNMGIKWIVLNFLNRGKLTEVFKNLTSSLEIKILKIEEKAVALDKIWQRFSISAFPILRVSAKSLMRDIGLLAMHQGRNL